MTKTYSRARAAKAVATKLLANWEVAEDTYTIETPEAEPGRWAVRIVFSTPQDVLLLEDLIDAGIAFDDPDAEERDGRPFAKPAEVTNPADVPMASSSKSGYIRGVSSAEGPTALVHEIANSMPGATRKEVIDACRAAGVTYGTARTQYQKWFSAHKQNNS